MIPLLLLYRCRKLFSVGPDVTEIDKRARLSLPHTDSDYVKFIRRWLKGEIIPPTKYEDPSFYYVLTNLTNQIKEGMKNVTSLNGEGSATNLQLKQPSEFPTSGSLFTPEINARTWLVPTTKDEYLIVFHRDLFLFCYLFSKVISMVTSIGYRYDQHISLKENIRLHVSTIVANIERLEEVDIILPRLKDLISSVLFGGSIGLSKTFDPEEWYVDQAVMYADSMEIFDLAHEYAHTVCGHLTDSKTVHSYVANRGTQQEVTELAYSHKHEFEADINGLHYMLGTLHNRRTSGSLPPGSWVFLPPWSLCGPTILFQFFDVIERSKSIITKGQEYPSESSLGSHPPPLVRLNQLRQHIHNIWGTSSWGESLLEPSLMIDKPDMKKGFCSFRGLELLPHLYV